MPVLAALLLLLFTAVANAAEGPYLELDTKGHMALIRSIVFTPDGSELISASDDKTIRVWDAGTGRIVPSEASSETAIRARSMRSRSPATGACSLPAAAPVLRGRGS